MKKIYFDSHRKVWDTNNILSKSFHSDKITNEQSLSKKMEYFIEKSVKLRCMSDQVP